VGPGGQTLREGRALVGWGSGADKRGRLVRENAGERAWVVRAERLASGPGKVGRTGLTSGPGGARSWLAGVAESGADRWARGRGEGEGDALGRAG